MTAQVTAGCVEDFTFAFVCLFVLVLPTKSALIPPTTTPPQVNTIGTTGVNVSASSMLSTFFF